ncbi:MAG: glycosyltransferase family 2 protein [Bacteroides sp.]|nr:glycosyltransferase family 2 protein [Bacteroides sp.]
MVTEPKITVLVPIYGVERYIGRCVRSLFEQTMTEDVEFIFVNDCTKDCSMDILRDMLNQYPSRQSQVKLVNHKENRGLAAARITALNLAKGEYVINLDSDDHFETDMLECMYAAAKKQNADIVVADYYLSYRKREIYISCPIDEDENRLIGNMICNNEGVGRMVWNKLIKRELYEKYSVRPLHGINIGEDMLTVAQLLFHAASISRIDRAFVHYNRSNHNTYTSNPSYREVLNRFVVCDFLSDFFGENSIEIKEAINQHRFQIKAMALIYSPHKYQRQILSYHPLLTYHKYRYALAWYWRFPLKLGFNGNLVQFNALRTIVLKFRTVYRYCRDIV